MSLEEDVYDALATIVAVGLPAPIPSIEILRPNADGDVIELFNRASTQIANWSYVDEAIADDDVSFVYSPSGGSPLMDLYNLPAHSGTGTISGITVHARVETGQAPYDYLRLAIKTGGVIYYSDLFMTADYVYEAISYEWVLNPFTGLAWTLGEIDALQIGVQLMLNSETTRCSQLYVEVEYAGAPRVYRNSLPQPYVLPAITYFRVDTVPELSHGSDNDANDLIHPRFQISCWATTNAAAVALAKTVRTTFKAWVVVGTKHAEWANQYDLTDPDTGVHQVIVDFIIWVTE
jgi:hypothetical protein